MLKILEHSHLEDLEDRFYALVHHKDNHACSDCLHDEVFSANNFKTVADENHRILMANWRQRITSCCRFSVDAACMEIRLIDRLMSTTNGKPMLCEKSIPIRNIVLPSHEY